MPKKRKPVVALFLSLITPGLGQMYNGEIRKAIFFFVINDLLGIVFALGGFFFSFRLAVLSLCILAGLAIFAVVDATITARKRKEISLKTYNRWYFYLAIWFVGSFVVLPITSSAVKDHVIRPWRIASNSMLPSLTIGDHVIANVGQYKTESPRRGDVVIFAHPKDPSKDFVKRIMGLGGEKIEIIQDTIYINDKMIEDPWKSQDNRVGQAKLRDTHFGPVSIPEKSVFVVGDHRSNSQDSRHFGFVDVNAVKGKLLYIYWARDKSRIGVTVR